MQISSVSGRMFRLLTQSLTRCNIFKIILTMSFRYISFPRFYKSFRIRRSRNSPSKDDLVWNVRWCVGLVSFLLNATWTICTNKWHKLRSPSYRVRCSSRIHLGPLLLLIFFNDFPKCSNFLNFTLFANKSSLTS